MNRIIRVQEARSGLDCRLLLLDDAAPRHAGALWSLAGSGAPYAAQHAMWTGPEISCPITADRFPDADAFRDIPLENGTSFPRAGDIATVFAPAGTWMGQPPSDFFDVGLLYGEGARLLMPMGWIMASVSARVLPDDMAAFAEGCRAIRRNGACELTFSRVTDAG